MECRIFHGFKLWHKVLLLYSHINNHLEILMNKMSKKTIYLITALFFALSVVSCSEAAAQTSKTKYERWEYTNLDVSSNTLEEANKLGAEGWELVLQSGGYNNWRIIFKRRLP
jgi:hypothetical protein